MNTSPSPSFDDAIAFAQDLIRIPSMPGEEGDLTRRVQAEMEALGYDEVYTDELGSVVGVVRGGKGPRPSVMLSAHLDMVAAGDAGEWEYPPFDGVIAGGYLHGRGAMDIKGPLALQVHVAAALRGRVAGGYHRGAPRLRGTRRLGHGSPRPCRGRTPPGCRDHRRVDPGRHRDRAPGQERGRDRRTGAGGPRVGAGPGPQRAGPCPRHPCGCARPGRAAGIRRRARTVVRGRDRHRSRPGEPQCDPRPGHHHPRLADPPARHGAGAAGPRAGRPEATSGPP